MATIHSRGKRCFNHKGNGVSVWGLANGTAMNVREASRRKVNEITQFVTAQIERGELSGGDRLPTEKNLIEQFDAARNTVRKALAKLEDDGLIERHVGRGTFVRSAPGTTTAGEPDLQSIDASPAEINEIRVLLEPAVAELVVARATKADIDYARKCLDNSLAATSIEDYEHWDAELHATVIGAARNTMLSTIYSAIDQARRNMEWHEIKRRSLNEKRRDSYNEHHSRIVDALTRRDAVALRAALDTHLRAVSHNMLNPAQ